MADLKLPDGWTPAPGADGHTVATKWFDGHYKTVEVADGTDLQGAVEAVELEAKLRAQAGVDADRAVAADLRAEADRVDPDVVVAAPAPEPAPAPEVPAPPVVVPSVEELRAAAPALADAPAEPAPEPAADPQPTSEPDEPVSALAPDPVPDAAPVAAPDTTPTEGA